PTGVAYSKLLNNQLSLLSNKAIKFSRWEWADGSQAIIDGRGLLHLKSSDKSIPEITIALITGAPTACWTSNGNGCGSNYFIESTSLLIDTEDFFNYYIKKFIEKLR